MKRSVHSVKRRRDTASKNSSAVEVSFFGPQQELFFQPVKARAQLSMMHYLKNPSGGNLLPVEQRQFFKNRMGHDFTNVKIHTGREASHAAGAINAQAYTYKNHIVFNENKYQPGNTEGKKLLAHELTHVTQSGAGETISRKILLPFEKSAIFNAKSKTPATQAKATEDLLNKLCVDGGITVSGGLVRPSPDLCDLPGPIGGNPALTKAEQSKTKTGCTCICDLVRSPLTVRLVIDDGTAGTTLAESEASEKPGVGSGSTVTVPSEDADRTVLPTKSGKLLAIDPVINIGHELCGHAWLNERGESGKDRSPQRGRGGHQLAVERENLIRDEQGVERRATFREPFCGEDPKGHFIEECKKWRAEYNKLNGTSFKIDDSIPLNPLEEKPADFRIEVGFNKDAPQTWFNPSVSFSVSVTDNGKDSFGFALGTLLENGMRNFQLEGHASSDKPVSIPDYNEKLSERRVRLILTELMKRGVDKGRLKNKKDSDCPEMETGMKNCSDSEAGAPGTAADRKVVIRIF